MARSCRHDIICVDSPVVWCNRIILLDADIWQVQQKVDGLGSGIQLLT